MASPQPRDDLSGLSESTFEFVARDIAEEGSQDDHTDPMSESPPEYERYPHPDEVRAFNGLDDMSQSASAASTFESASEDEELASQQESPLYMHEDPPHNPYEDEDEMLRNSFTQGSNPRLFQPNPRPILPAGSIEFSEPEDVDVHIDKISVKHTIKEFSEKDAALLFQSLSLDDVPKRLCATIRQTMSQRCLSTHDAFRVLYIGDEDPKGEIVLKISRAITCSSSVDYNENKTLRKNTEGIYNIVPVTFGAVNDRDVELMEATGFQIKVDTCVDAEKIPIEGGFFRGDIVYSLTVDGGNGGKKYKSVPAGGREGAKVYPAWSFPHVAVVYCSEDDDEDMRRVQRIAWEFCHRHAIPCLYISDQPAFVSPAAAGWRNHTHEHAIHLSLESREPKSRESDWPEQRFPIDLASFLNIDNRQMNQNLAYLTGLQEASVADEKMKDSVSLSGGKKDISNKGTKVWEAYVDRLLQPCSKLIDEHSYSSILCSLAFVLLVGVSAWLTSGVSPTFVPVPAGAPIADVQSVTPVMVTSTATVTVSQTSTRTVRLSTVETPAFGGLLSDIAHTVSSDASQKSSICTVEMYSGNEILIKLPSGTKTSWLAKGAIDVDVFRGSDPVKSKLSSIDEGILIEIQQKDAYGVLDVSVVTTRKPKINETFTIDFGTSFFSGALDTTKHAFEDLYEKLVDTANDAAKAIEDKYASSDFASTEQKLMDEAASWWESMRDASKTAHEYSSQKAGDAFGRLKDSLRTEDMTLYLRNVQQAVADRRADILERQSRMAGDLRDDADLAVLKAQITSKLWWLKLQGKTEEHDEYERQARDFLKKRHDTLEAKKLRRTGAEAKCPRTGNSPCRCKNKGLGCWMV